MRLLVSLLAMGFIEIHPTMISVQNIIQLNYSYVVTMDTPSLFWSTPKQL